MSDSAPLSERINGYGAYDFGAGLCFIWNEGNCNKEHTIQFLQRMADWLQDGPGAVLIIWDGATWHRAKAVQVAAAKLGLTLFPLPAYSPDLNPIENLWRWMREEDAQPLPYVHAPPLRPLQSLHQPHQSTSRKGRVSSMA